MIVLTGGKRPLPSIPISIHYDLDGSLRKHRHLLLDTGGGGWFGGGGEEEGEGV